MARLISYEFLRSPKLGAMRQENHDSLIEILLFSASYHYTHRVCHGSFAIALSFWWHSRLQI